ncbi:MAG: aminotransferase class V-fold PLP-dependent enzyme, partial [Halobacteria archaeon]|nr:aminotransferase class V-fold PLP-dependent enzyme [Halobacteria archaeon]
MTKIPDTPDELRASLPALENCIYLNTGASGPSPRNVVEAIEDALEYHEYESPADNMYSAGYEYIEDGRAAVASLLNT